MKAEWFIGPSISIVLFGITVYYINKKYQPIISAANATNTALGVFEHPIDSIEQAWTNVFGANSGNGNATTPSMMTPNIFY